MGELGDLLHHGREAGDRSGAQIITVGKAARDDDGIDSLKISVTVPEDHRVARTLGGELRVDLVA